MSFASDLQHSVRTRVALVTLLMLALSMGVLTWYASDLLRRDIEGQAGMQQNMTAHLLAGRINDQISLRLQALEQLATSLTAEQQADAGALQLQLHEQAVLQRLFNGGLLVVDEVASVSAAVPQQTPQASQRFALTPADRAFLNQLTQAAVARPGWGQQHPTAGVSLVAPLVAVAGQPRRWLVGVVAWRGSNFMEPLGVGATVNPGYRFLLLSDRFKALVVASDAPHAMATGAPAVVDPGVDTLLADAPGTRTVRGGNAEQAMVSSAAVPAANWRLVALLPLTDVFAPSRVLQQRLWLVATLLTLLAGTFVGWMLRRQFRPLVQAARALAEPMDLHTLPDRLPAAGPDEVGVLMERTHRLLQQIGSREQALDAQTDELTQINQQLQAILQHVPQLVWLKDLQGRYITCNARFEAFFDLPIATVMGRTDEDFFVPEQARMYREDDQRCLQSQTMSTVQRWLPCAEGARPVLLEVNKIALRDAKGQAQAILGIGQDVTERWRSTQFEQLRSKVLELLVMATPLPVLLQHLADGLHAMQSEWSCALMLLQDGADGSQRLRVAASAGLDETWTRWLNDTTVQDGTSGCAIAAATGKRVVIGDIAKSEAAPEYRAQARRADLGACWAQPLLDAHSAVVGVFTIYQRCVGAPAAADLELLTHLSHLAEIALNRAHAGARLRASEASFRALSENTPEAVLVHRHGNILYANPAAVRLFGASTAAELQHKTTQELVAPEFLPQQLARMRAIERGEPVPPTAESRFLRLDGRAIDVELQGTRLVFDGAPAIHVSLRDITQRNETKRQLKLAASVFEHALEGIVITNAQATIVDVNASFSRITGYGRDEVLGHNPRLLQSGRHDVPFYQQMWAALLRDGSWSGEMCNRRKDGQIYMQMLHISTVRSAQGEVLQCVGLFSDITARKSQEDRLNHLAHFDALTGLPNRTLHADRLRQAMANVMRRHKKLGVAFVDLDGFKAVNDNHGHDAGDHVLVTLAKRMRQALREVDTLSRIGGDEFAAIIVDLEYESDCDPLLQRLLAAANEPMLYKGHRLQVSASVGVTFYPQTRGISADQLLQQADLAMYQAKHQGKNQVQVSGFSDL